MGEPRDTLREEIGQIIDPLGLEIVARMNRRGAKLPEHGMQTRDDILRRLNAKIDAICALPAIADLVAENDRLKAAVQPFGEAFRKANTYYRGDADDRFWSGRTLNGFYVNEEDFRRAAQAVGTDGGGGK